MRIFRWKKAYDISTNLHSNCAKCCHDQYSFIQTQLLYIARFQCNQIRTKLLEKQQHVMWMHCHNCNVWGSLLSTITHQATFEEKLFVLIVNVNQSDVTACGALHTALCSCLSKLLAVFWDTLASHT